MENTKGRFLAGKRIVVVGGGIAGCTFVSALNQLWDTSLKRPKITVIERDARDISVLKDPYVLTLKGGTQDDGLIALQQMGLLDNVRTHATINTGTIRVWGDDWSRELASINPKPYGNLPAAAMRIRRQDLKRILVEHAEKTNATWIWGCTCTNAERLTNGQMRVTFSDSATGRSLSKDCDLLIAADGSESKIGAILRPGDMELEYAGASQIGGISRFPKGLPSPVNHDFSLQMSSGEGICCIYSPFDNETIGWALSRVEPERKAKNGPFPAEEFAALKSEALETGSMFQEPFRTVVEATMPDTVFVRPARERQPFRNDIRLGRTVFIGDANHLLSPFELVGANLALTDGWDLAHQLCQNDSIETAFTAYDKLSLPRAEHDIKFSHERIRFGHSTGFLWKLYKYGMAAQRALSKS